MCVWRLLAVVSRDRPCAVEWSVTVRREACSAFPVGVGPGHDDHKLTRLPFLDIAPGPPASLLRRKRRLTRLLHTSNTRGVIRQTSDAAT